MCSEVPEQQAVRMIDEYTNRFLTEYPVHCELRTMPLGNLHSHKGFEIYLCLQGKGSYIVGDRLYPLHSGTLTIIHPHVSHRPVSESPRELHRYVLSVDEAYLERLSGACPDINGGITALLAETGSQSSHLFLTVTHLAQFRSLLAELTGLLQLRPPYFELQMLKLMSELLLLIIEIRGQLPAVGLSRSENERLIDEVLAHLITHYQEDLRIEDLLRQFPVSRSRLFGLFKQTTGSTITQFLTEFRIHKAKNLLADTALPITEIAARTGFGDLSHYFNVFKRQTGMTPKQYRAQAAQLTPHDQLAQPAPPGQLAQPAPHDQLAQPAPHDQLAQPAPHDQLAQPVPLDRLAQPLQPVQSSQPAASPLLLPHGSSSKE
ncbi:MAG: hypothetical protein K0R57_5069 [Paenibacillaceae bacterium]|jgi:AraC-like DNA-binding protein/mannose-6-phosphate isomerase-like protein (cupin superfamily)|nr:hypothetical protein [Paenibacillaceae bacterium]